MKKIIFILSLVLLFSNFAFAEFKILPKDIKNGRNAEVYANYLRIKMAKGNYEKNKVATKIASNNAIVFRQLANPQNSLSFNKDMRTLPKYQNADINQLIKTEEPLLRTFVIKYDGDIAPEKYAKYIVANNPDVIYAEPIYVDRIMQFVPNDTYVGTQEMLYTIKAFEAWEIEKGDPDVVVGISDSGVMKTHQDLVGGIKPNEKDPINNIDDDGNGYIDDYDGCDLSTVNSDIPANDTYNQLDGHGTEVAGIAVARTNNATGIAGVGNQCSYFPIKVADGINLFYSYESLKYAADIGIDVLNISWGRVKNYSQIDQDLVDYAVARDVAIIASAGNNDDTILETWYPAAYRGVLGVGQVTGDDYIIPQGTVLGVSCDIMAPGDALLTTANDGTYTNNTSGTSYSSPVVAGVTALVRSKWKELNAMQTLMHVKQSIDDISQNNFASSYLNVLPGRVNALKAVDVDPFSRPGINVNNYIYLRDATETDKFNIGDIIELEIDAYNHLGASDGLYFKLSVAQDYSSSAVVVTDSVTFIENIEENSPLNVSGFKFRIDKKFESAVIMRIDIYDENGYSDFVKFELFPTREFKDFVNGTISFSMSDYGAFGYHEVNDVLTFGQGFSLVGYGNNLFFDSGLMATENLSNAVSAYFDDFNVVKPFDVGDRPNTLIINDDRALANTKIGVEIAQTVTFPELNENTARIDLEAKNISDRELKSLSIGYFLDWDVNQNETQNKTSLFEDRPEFAELDGSFTSQIAEYIGNDFAVFGAMVYSPDSDDNPQAAGLNYDFIYNFDLNGQINVMNSGTSIQNPNVEDISTFIGMQFYDNIEPNNTAECVICIGGAENKDLLAKYLYECVTNTTSVNENVAENKLINLFPIPAKDYINISFNGSLSGFAEISIVDLSGKEVLKSMIISTENTNKIDVSHLNTGIYILKLKQNETEYTKKFIKF